MYHPSSKSGLHSLHSYRSLHAGSEDRPLQLLRLFDFFDSRKSRKVEKSKSIWALVALCCAVMLILSCAPPVERPTGPAGDYQDAKDMFKRNRFDRTLDFTDGLATASPPTKFTERARVLRVVVYTGQLKSAKALADAYEKGAEQSRNSHIKAEYERLRHDDLQFAAKAALGLAETAHQLTASGAFPKETILEAPYPNTEGPLEVTELERVKAGGWIEPDQQESAATDSMNKGMDDALGAAVSGDRSKARTDLANGSTKIDGVDFAVFLGNQLVDGASVFDRKHVRDSEKLRTVCEQADLVAKAALGLLKDNPNKDKEKDVKKIQDHCKTMTKNL